MKLVTMQMLVDGGACLGQRMLFREKFGDRVVVTPDRAAEHASEFAWCWAASRWLSAKKYAEFDMRSELAAVERNKAVRAVWDKHNREIFQIRDTYSDAVSEFRTAGPDEYRVRTAPAKTIYDEAYKAACEKRSEGEKAANLAFRQAQARIFAELFNSQARKRKHRPVR